MWSFEKMVSGRYFRSKRKEGVISLIAGFSFLGIMLGVATLIIVMSVMNGFRAELLGRIVGLNGHLNVYTPGATIYPYAPTVERLKKIPGVVNAAPSTEGQALLTSQGNAGGVIIRGITPEDFKRKPVLSTGILRALKPGFGEQRVAIGKNLATRFGVDLGDKIMLIAPKGKTTPFGTIPRSMAFEVGAIFDVGMYEYNSNFIFMPLDTSQVFLDIGEGVSTIELMTKDADNDKGVKDAVVKAIPKNFEVSDWRDSNASFYNALQVERNVMFLILTLIIVVAAFNIISSLIMLVKDKGRDIAILRTMGAPRASIVRIFFFTGARIGIFGTLAGALLGVVFCENIERIRRFLESLTGTNLFSEEIYFLSTLPAKMERSEVALITGMALFLSFLATIYPAWRAARIDPAEALRYE